MDLPELPSNKEITYLGLSTYRDKNQLFGIKRKDRRQHVYLLGKSGTGKSVLMFNMIIQNIQNGDGVCLVDPHGENVEGVLSAIPKHRIKDVIYFNPADPNHHIGFNVLELVDPQYKHLVASGLMGIFTKIWANAWSARMEYILNNTILALLDTPGTTLLGIPRMLVDKDYRQKIISNLKDPVIKAFWVHEYEAWQDKFRNEAIAPIQNKVGQFLSTSIIRNVVGQSKSTINIFDMMNEGKIFLVNVSKGRIGEDNSALLGGMIITKIQLAAMERVRIPEGDRKDFYLYVDEFQNFVTDSFAGILSEARKYRLNLTIAHQYTAQLINDKSTTVRDAVFGNVGTMIVFRVGADDAEFLEKEFDPEFTPQDIVNLPNYKVYMKLMIDGVTSRPFSAKTLPPMVESGNKEVEEEVIESSRRLYCRTKEEVEAEINNWSGMSLGDYDTPSSKPSSNPNLEKFDITCSLCNQQKTVPFKPEPGRPVYCKECVAKIKSGEVKIAKGKDNNIKHDEATFFKPLAELGIEFSDEETKPKGPESGDIKKVTKETPKENTGSRLSNNVPVKSQVPVKPIAPEPAKKDFYKDYSSNHKTTPENPSQSTSSIRKSVRSHSSRGTSGENLALREALNKTLSEQKTNTPEAKVNQPPAEVTSAPKPVSLNTLNDETKPSNKGFTSSKDRAATREDMDDLKSLILEKIPTSKEGVGTSASEDVEADTKPSSEDKSTDPAVQTPIPTPPVASTPIPTPPPSSAEEDTVKASSVGTPSGVAPSASQPKEVPEDVLRKVLE